MIAKIGCPVEKPARGGLPKGPSPRSPKRINQRIWHLFPPFACICC